jgi:hypothetical protein
MPHVEMTFWNVTVWFYRAGGWRLAIVDSLEVYDDGSAWVDTTVGGYGASRFGWSLTAFS